MNYKNLLFFGAIAVTLFSQHQVQSQSRGNWCYTDQYNAELQAKYPEYAAQRAKTELEIQNYIRSGKDKDVNKKRASVKIIPVVVHVVTDRCGGGISKAQVLDGIRVLNEDFRRLNADRTQTRSIFQGVAADSEIEFRLAKIDPNGQCTEGINRVVAPQTNSVYSRDSIKTAVPRWDPNKYFNVWLVNSISSPDNQTILGYAQFPGTGPVDLYGVVMRHDEWGAIGSATPTGSTNQSHGRTATHEIGHCLNLYHTFQGSCGSNCDSSGDFVCDTPPAFEATYNCGYNLNTCSNDTQGGNANNPNPYTSNMPDQIENYMSYNTCQNMFTAGQKARMMAALNTHSFLINLTSPANLIATGTNDGYIAQVCKPIADFCVTQRICEGLNVQFTDASFNAEVDSTWEWSWSFPGAVPDTSSQRNPLVNYPAAGTYSATLTVKNAAGVSTVTKTNIIQVGSLTNNVKAPFTESFESTAFPNNPANQLQNWEIEAYSSAPKKQPVTWRRVSGRATDGNNSMVLDLNANSPGSINSLVSPTFDGRNLRPTVYLEFDYAYAKPRPYSSSITPVDELKIYVSADCGRNWRLVRTINPNNGLVTTSRTAQNFVPNASEWKSERIAINSIAGNNSQRIKIEATSGTFTYSNNLYIDKFRITGTVINGTAEDEVFAATQLYPNPVNSQTQLAFTLAKTEKVKVEVFDVLGRKVYTEGAVNLEPGKHSLNLLEKTGKLDAGVYMVRLYVNESSRVFKVIAN